MKIECTVKELKELLQKEISVEKTTDTRASSQTPIGFKFTSASNVSQEIRKEDVKMKIEIDESNIEELKNLKNSIEGLLSIYKEDMEATEENLEKVTKAVNKVNSCGVRNFKFGLMKTRIVSSVGAKLTIT